MTPVLEFRDLTLVFKATLIVAIVFGCNSETVTLFIKFTGPSTGYETKVIVSSPTCTALPDDNKNYNREIGTTGCIVVYRDDDKTRGKCEREGYTVWERVEMASIEGYNRRYPSPQPEYFINSVRDCTDMERKLELDIDFIEGEPSAPGKKLELRNILTCTNLPSFEDFKDRNHHGTTYGKCVKFFIKEDCGGKPTHYMYETQFEWNKDYKWLSVEPCTVRADFYGKELFEGQVERVELTPGESQRVSKKLQRVSSFKGTGCLVFHLNLKYDEDYEAEPASVFHFQASSMKYIGSHVDGRVSICNDRDSKMENNIDHYERLTSLYVGPVVSMKPFRRVCECLTLPELSTTEKTTQYVDTHGQNCYNLYYTQDCTGESLKSFTIIVKNYLSPWRSMKPCITDTTTCILFKAHVFHLEAIMTKSDLIGHSKDVSIANMQTFHNDGFATIHQSYSVSKALTETAKFEFSKGLREMETTGFAVGMETSFDVSVPFISSAAVTLKADFNKEWTKEETSTNTFSHEVSESKMFTISEDITVKPCTHYEVTSIVRLAQDVIIDYRVLFLITGKFKNGTIVAEKQLKESIHSFKNQHLTIIDNHEKENDTAIVAESRAKLTADYGRNSIFTGTGDPIPECLQRHKDSICC